MPLPEGPIASPAAGAAVRTARVRVEVLPLGSVVYDGQVLPLVSPDGRFLAVEAGEAPTWETLLARPGAIAPMRTSLAVYDITAPTPRPITFGQPLPAGLVLGRAADDRGFLVEAPRPDGSRWIGRVEWLSGRFDWIVQDDLVNAHAVLTPDGSMVYSRRDVRAGRAELVLRRPDGTEDARSEPDESYLFPTASSDTGVIFTLVESPIGLELAAFALTPDPALNGRRRLGALIARARLSPTFSPELAYQVTAATPPALPLRADSPRESPGHAAMDGLVVHVPQGQRLGRFDLATGAFDLFPARSVAAAVSRDPATTGYFTATTDGLVFVPNDELSRHDPAGHEPSSAPVLGDPYVPRATTNTDRPFVLIGPVQRDPKRLRLLALALPPGGGG
jgi:hypothetical protein